MTAYEVPYRDTTVEVEEGETVTEFRERMDAHPDTQCLIIGPEGEEVWGVLREEYVVHSWPDPELMRQKWAEGFVLDFQLPLDHPEHPRNQEDG